MRAAIYARYSSDLQRDTSLEDQIAVARHYASERSWTVLKEHVYTDAGISGASIQNRPASNVCSPLRHASQNRSMWCSSTTARESPATFQTRFA